MAEVEGKRLTELRVIDLKTELERRGLDKSGNKAALLERLSKVIPLSCWTYSLRELNHDTLSKGVTKLVAMLTLSIQQHIFYSHRVFLALIDVVIARLYWIHPWNEAPCNACKCENVISTLIFLMRINL